MLPNSSTVLLILGACAIAGVALGFGVDWIISRIRRARRAGEANYANAERETGAAIAEDIDRPSPEQGRIESEPAQEYQEAAGTGAGDDDWLNDGVPEVSTTDIKSDDERWLNVESVEAD